MKIAILNTLKSSPSVIPPKSGDSMYTFWLAYYCNLYGADARIFSMGWKDETKEFLRVTEQIVKGLRVPLPKNPFLKFADCVGYPILGQSFSQFLLGCNFHVSKSIGLYGAEVLDCQNPTTFAETAYKISRKLGIPLIITALDNPSILLYRHVKEVAKKMSLTANLKPIIFPTLRKEMQAYRKADHIICTTLFQVEFISSLNIKKEKISLIPLGIPLDFYKSSGLPLTKKDLGIENFSFTCIFIGAKGYYPNEVAVNDIISVISKKLPDVGFLIVGRGWRPAKIGNVLIVGEVEDLSPYLNLADIAIAHLRLGGVSMKQKVLTYLAAGKPVISTSIGVFGIQERSEALIIEDDIKKFPEHIKRLQKQDLNKLSKEALKVAKNYDWKMIVKKYLNIVEELINSHKENGL